MRPERVAELTSPSPVVSSRTGLGTRSRSAPGTTSADKRVAFADGVAVKLKLITLLHRDRDLVAGEPIQLVVGLPAPGQARGSSA